VRRQAAVPARTRPAAPGAGAPGRGRPRRGRTAEEGIALYLRRFQLPAEHESLRHVVLGLGYLDDVEDDELVPVERAVVERYWRRRQPEIVRHLSRFGG
jgi:hypothetical protein